MASIREKVLGCNDLGSEVLEVPEWGVTFKVKGLSRGALQALLKSCTDEKGVVDNDKFVPTLLVATLCDPLNDQPAFQKEDLEALDGKAVKPLMMAYHVATRVCGLSDARGLEKNSEQTESGASPSV